LARVAVAAVSLGVVVSAPGAAEATTGSIVVRLVTDRRHPVLRGHTPASSRPSHGPPNTDNRTTSCTTARIIKTTNSVHEPDRV
jgi:hypothetical protein